MFYVSHHWSCSHQCWLTDSGDGITDLPKVHLSMRWAKLITCVCLTQRISEPALLKVDEKTVHLEYEVIRI